MNFKLTIAIWAISFVIAGFSMPFMNWVFAISFGIFCLTTVYMDYNKKRFEGDLDEMFGREESFD